ncbi:MAG TPA: serine hydrolase, partial [bacterium]|nr:serine hydrolase [bacterium]
QEAILPTYAQAIRPVRSFISVASLLTWHVDRERQEVTGTIAGSFPGRAVYAAGRGCTVLPAPRAGAALATPAPISVVSAGTPALLPPLAGPEPVEPRDGRLRAALDGAFAETQQPHLRRTKAVVVVQRGRIVAERYAPGYGPATPILGWSVSKSVTSALVGILVRQGRLQLRATAPIAAWRDPANPRHAITLDILLRMTSGLDLTETGSGRDPNSRMLYLEPDMAGFASGAALKQPPGSTWSYMSGNYVLLARIVEDAVGGHPEDFVRFAQQELFAPLGMDHVTLEFDAAGTPIGSSYFLAPAREWARFGLLYLYDGAVGGRRILPEGWVQASARPTLGTDYGAGFWTNQGDSPMAVRRRHWGMPADSFFAQGILGQFIVVVPSAQLVVARFGETDPALHNDMAGVSRLVGQVLATLPAAPAAR